VCNVGVANAMRVEFSPNGPVNTPEFGTVTDETEATALYEMDGGHFTEEKIVTFKNFAGQYAFMLWQAGHKEFQPTR
jgi:prolyl oligopeptidase